MRNLYSLAFVAAVIAASCGSQPSAPATTAAAPGPAPAPHANLAQMMRAIPFPASNLIFDTQTTDPGAPAKPGGEGATAKFSGVYGGWAAVENSGLALAETANLLLVPGRKCQNGRPVPNDREDFKKFTQGLIDAGMSSPIYADPQVRAMREGRVPLGRLGRADDISRAVLWLLSDESEYITGDELLVDGGVTISVIAGLPRPQAVDAVGVTPGNGAH